MGSGVVAGGCGGGGEGGELLRRFEHIHLYRKNTCVLFFWLGWQSQSLNTFTIDQRLYMDITLNNFQVIENVQV